MQMLWAQHLLWHVEALLSFVDVPGDSRSKRVTHRAKRGTKSNVSGLLSSGVQNRYIGDSLFFRCWLLDRKPEYLTSFVSLLLGNVT